MRKTSAILICTLTFALAALTGCTPRTNSPTNATTTTAPTGGAVTTNPVRGAANALDRAAEDTREFLSGLGTTRQAPYNTGINRTGMAGTTNAQTARDELSVDHLTALMGMGTSDLNTALGQGRMLSADRSSNGRTYTQRLYGKDTDFDVRFNGDEKVDQIIVNVSPEDAERWQRELNGRFGQQTYYNSAMRQWLADKARVDWTENDGMVKIIFTNNAI